MIGERLLRVAHHAFIILVVLASTIVLSAQTVVDPQYVEFTASADHNAVASDGTPLVQRYSLSIFALGSSVAFDTVDLGKPAPSAGVIRVNFIPLLHTQPTPNVVYEARVTAVGPGGSTASSVSNGFSFQATAPPCAPTINSTGQSVGSGATTGSVGVTAGTGCAWTAASNAGWVTLTGATSGTGNGSVPYSVAANTTTSPRTATLTVAGKPYTITQAALSCTYAIAPTSGSLPANGGTGSTGVTSPAGCAWTGVSNRSWLTVTGGASGSGNGTVTFSATANSSTSSRTGTLTIAGQSFSVTQSGINCTYAIAPTSGSVPAGGGTGSTGVTSPTACAWTGVSNNTSWLTVTGGASGSGNGTVTFSAAANSSINPRTGTLTIAGRTFSVTQPGLTCTYSIVPTSGSVAAGGGTGSTSVTALAGCAWTGVSNNTSWLTVTGGASGSGSGTVAFSAAANSSINPRTGTLTIAGQSFSVTQPGLTCTYSIVPTSGSVPAGGGTGSTGVTSLAGCAWTGVSNNTSWLTVTSGASGSGSGTVAFSATANSSTSSRTGTLTIAGQSFSVTQPGIACTFTLSAPSGSVPAGGGTGSTGVTSPAGCAWTGISNNTSWLTVTGGASGNGSGTVAFSAAANSSINPRTGTLTIAGQSFSVTQPGLTCTYSIVPTSGSVPAAGGSGSTGVTSLAGCAWTGVSNNTSWLTVTGGASGSGSGTVAFSATANSSTSSRTGTLTIAGQSFSVTQPGITCTFTLSAASGSVPAAGGTGSTGVTSPAGCAWTGVSNSTSWLTVTGGASGSGSGTVAFSATANSSTSSRTGTLTIAGQSFSVTQPGIACTYAIAPTSGSVPSNGGTGSTGVTSPAGCAWTGVSNSTSWLTVTSGGSGSGSGTVAFSAAANSSTSSRTGTLTIAGQSFSVTQPGITCTFTLSAPSGSVAAGGGTGSTGVTSPAGCAWTGVSNNTSWLTVTGGASGSGSGTVAFSAAANSSTTSRTGTLTIAGQSFSVTQPGIACTYAIAPTSGAVAANGGTGSTGVTSPAGCAWTGISNDTSWLTVTGGASGSGSGTVAFSAAANSSTTSRTGTLTIAGQSFSVTQPGITCTFTLSAPSGSVAANGGTGSTGVTSPAGCAWTGVSNNTSWLTVTGGASGSGSGTVAFSAAANSSINPRTGTLTIAGQSFSVTQPGINCTYAIAPTSGSVAANGGTGSTAVTSPAGCAWTGASNDTSWLTVTGGASGSGSGTVAFSAAANSSINPRTGTLTIAGQSFSVTQPGINCTFTLAATSGSVPASGGTGSTGVTSPAGCAWTGISNNTSWLAVTGGASGSGSGTVAFSAAANSSINPRTGTLTIAGQSFSVTQPGINCTFTLAATSGSVPASGGTGSTGVTSLAGCAWTGVSNNTSWLTVTGGASGTGNGTVAFSAAANSSTSSRTGTLTIAGQSFSVTQPGIACTYTLAATSGSVPASGGTGSTGVTSLAGCAWTGVSNDTSWLTVTGGASGSGSGTVAFSAAANSSINPRTGTLTIAGQSFSVTQPGIACTYTLAATSGSVPASGGIDSTGVTAPAGCAWTGVSNNTSWLTVTGGASGTGNGTVAFSAAANSSTSSRTGTLTIAGQSFSVTQPGITCTFTLSATSGSVPASGGTGSTGVTAPAGCAWTGVSNSTSWLTVTSGGSGTGNGSVTFTAAANTTGEARTGTLDVAGQPFTITQAGAACDVTLTPTSRTVAAAGGASSTSVTATTGCAWTATSNTGWLTVTGDASGTGNGTVSFSAAANTSGQGRAGSLTIGGDTLTVNQDGAPCSFTVSPTAPSMSVAGGSLAITVTAGAGCSWTSSSTAAWVVATNSAGSGSGSADFTVAANMTSSARSAALSIAGRIITVTQAANTCSYTLSPGSSSIGGDGGTGTFTVSTGSGCPWAVTNMPAWISVSGTGPSSGSVTYTVLPNTTGINRSALLLIGPQAFIVSQGVTSTTPPPPPDGGSCSFTVSPTAPSMSMAGGSLAITVTAGAGCSWTSSSTATWVVASNSAGSGSGTAAFTVAANMTPSARSAALSIAGRIITVTQAANTCSYTLNPGSRSIGAEGGTGTITVSTGSGCPWAPTTSQAWISLSGTGPSSGSVTYTVQPNTTGNNRSGLLLIGPQTFIISQGVMSSLTPTSPAVPGGLRIVVGGQ